MKKTIAALVLLGSAVVIAGDYAVNVTVAKPTTTISTVVATTASVESINVILNRPDTTFSIRIALKDAEGNIIERKTALLTQEQLKVFLPSIDQIMAGGRASMSNNILSILELSK